MSRALSRPDAPPTLLSALDAPGDSPGIGRAWRSAAAALLLLSALSAIGGGGALVYFHEGRDFLPPVSLLDHTPFADFLIPGLILVLVVGGSGLLAGVLVLRRSRWAVDLTMLAGGVLLFWIIAEVAMMRSAHGLHWACGALGLAILLLGLHAARRSQVPRHRWVMTVTLAETCGFAAPVIAGVFSSNLQMGEGAQALLLVAAGGVEGYLLGAGQAAAMPVPIDRARFARFTAGGAAGAWAFAMVIPVVSSLPNVIVPAQIAIAVACGLLALASLVGAQWFALRRASPRAHVFALWTLLAWLVALPASFAPSPFVDEGTPTLALVALFGTAGVLMAYLMAVVTWQGARRL